MQDLDPILLFAFSDKSHSKERQAWKKFLDVLLPVILELEPGLVGEILESAHVNTLEEILASQKRRNDTKSFARKISAELSSALSLSPEFGFSCFLDFSPHTRVHAQSAKETRRSEEKILASWFKMFAELQEEEDFTEMLHLWKDHMDMLLESEQLLEESVAMRNRSVEEEDELPEGTLRNSA